MQIIDISPAVHSGTPVWPGDTEFLLTPKWSITGGDSVSVGTVTTTTHIGAHIDAPSHILAGAPGIDEIPLEACVGQCLVLDVSALVNRQRTPHRAATRAAIIAEITRFAQGKIERLLLRHYAQTHRGWDQDMPGIDPAFIAWFAEQGGKLIGIDLASFDLAESKELPAHRAAIRHGIVLLEGLDLSRAPVGEAELIALPMPWRGADASPVRAVLRIHAPAHDSSRTDPRPAIPNTPPGKEAR